MWAAPGEIRRFEVGVGGDKSKLAWCPAAATAGAATAYDVPRGAVAELPVGTGASELCSASGILHPTATDTATPLVGQGFWYLVRGRNVCGAGTYGFQSDGTQRTTSVCP